MKILFTVLKFALIWLVIAVAVIFGSILIFDNIGYGFKTLIILFGIWAVLFGLIKLVQRQAAKKRVSKLVDLKRGEKIDDDDGVWFPFKEYLTEDRTLFKRIKNIVGFLSKSKLKLNGNAVYAKPWYLLVGDKDSGKTALLNDSGIKLPTVDCKELKSEDGSIDFVVTNESIYIDMNHTYVPGDGEAIPQQFIQLLKALREHRNLEPLNGVLLVVNAEELMDDSKLETLSKKHAFYVNMVMHYLQIQLPVQLVITHTDKIAGFNEWSDLLNKKQLNEALGNHNVHNLDTKTFVEKTFDVISHKVSRVISFSFNANANKNKNSDALLFARELGNIRNRITSYTEEVFSFNEYQESAFLTGLYFVGLKEKNSGSSVFCFALGLLTIIFPNDRRRVHALGKFKRNVFIFSGLFLAFWTTLSFAVVFFFWEILSSSISDVVELKDEYNEKVYSGQIANFADEKGMRRSKQSLKIIKSNLVKKIYTYSFASEIAESVDESESGWMFPWENIVGIKDVGMRLKNNFQQASYRGLISDINKLLKANIAFSFSDLQRIRSTQEEMDSLTAEYALLLYRKIFLLQKYLAGDSEREIRNLDSVFSLDVKYFDGINNINQQDVEVLNDLYIKGLYWEKTSSKKSIYADYNATKKMLAFVLNQGSGDLQWVINWINESIKDGSVNVEDYFLGSGSLKSPVYIEPAYTTIGAKKVDQFIFEMEQLFKPGDNFYDKLSLFRSTYINSYVGAWSFFISRSTEGLKKLRGRDEWFSVIQQLSNQETNPYLSILDKAFKETQIVMDSRIMSKSRKFAKTQGDSLVNISVPEWIVLLDYFQKVKEFGNQTVEGKSNSKITKIALKTIGKLGKVGKKVAKIGKKVKKTAKKSKFKLKSSKKLDANVEKAAAELDKILLALSDAAFSADVRSSMYKDIESLFKNPDNPGMATGALGKLYASMKSFQFLLGLENKNNKPFWSLINASVFTVQKYMLKEAQEEINDLWGKQVLGELQGVPKDYRRNALIFKEKSGLLWAFYDKNLKPFLNFTSKGGLVATSVAGLSIGFDSAFIDYISQARDGIKLNKNKYPVFFESGPISTNKESLFKPTRVTISMVCGKNTYRSTNLNFYAKDLFEWNASCEDLTVDINFSMFSVMKVYEAPNGFPDFIKAFKGNVLKYVPSDFPDQESNLNDINVHEIRLNYVITGKKELSNGVNSFPKNMPNTITKLWD